MSAAGHSQLIGACVLLLISSASALPQTPAASFGQLIAEGVIQPHQNVYVTDAWGHRVKGRLGELRPGSLVLMQGTREIIPAENMTMTDWVRIGRCDRSSIEPSSIAPA